MIFGRFRKRKAEPEIEEVLPPEQEAEQIAKEIKADSAAEKEQVDIKDKKQRIDYIQRLYEGIQEAKNQNEQIKKEYAEVTSHLKDIQLMDQALDEDKVVVLQTASAIDQLMKERDYLKKRRYKFNDAQRQAMENFETTAADDVKKLKNFEDYQIKVKNDLHQLESEKQLLKSDKRDIINKQGTLRVVSKVLAGILLVFALLMLTIRLAFEVDVTVPVIATAAFAFLVLLVIMWEARANRTDMVITERKCNRAISLLNRVKIKYVNNTRTIDYMCMKYRVRNATELEFVYDQYQRAKREWARKRESVYMLNEKKDILVAELKKMGVKDAEIWCTQVQAIIEPKEMVEVRHDLNTRRQKLRSQIDYNTGIMRRTGTHPRHSRRVCKGCGRGSCKIQGNESGKIEWREHMNLLFLLKPKNTVDFLNGEDTVRAGLLKLRASGYTAAPVLSEEGKYIGTVTEGDFLWHLRDTPLDQETAVNHVYICEMMRENWNQPVHISATMEELLELVLNQNFVPVVDDRNYFVGIITRQSVIRHFVDRIQKLKHQVGEQELEKKEGEKE